LNLMLFVSEEKQHAAPGQDTDTLQYIEMQLGVGFVSQPVVNSSGQERSTVL